MKKGHLLVASLFISMFAWALATPVGGYENDETTLSAIYCSRAPHEYCQPDAIDAELFLVPRAFSRTSFERREFFFCHVASPNAKLNELPSARCLYNFNDSSQTYLENSLSAKKNLPLYPKLFASIMGLLATENLVKTILLVRLANIASCLLIFTLIYQVVGSKGLERTFVPWLIFMPSFGMFLLSGNTRSTWSVLGVGSSWLFVERAIHSKNFALRITSIVGLVLAFIFGTGSRSDSIFFTLLSLFVGLYLARNEFFAFIRRKTAVTIVGVVFSAVILTYVLVSLEFASLVTIAILKNSFKSNLIPNFPDWFMNRGVFLPEIILGAFGGNNGEESWQTAAPPLALVLNLISFGLVVATILKNQFREHRGVKILIIFLILIILYLFDSNGLGAKTRYIFPLIILSVGVAAYSKSSEPSMKTNQKLFLASCLGISYFLSLYMQIRRYVSGPTNDSWNLNSSPQWWWSVGPTPMSLLIIGTCAFLLLCLLIIGVSTKSEGKVL